MTTNVRWRATLLGASIVASGCFTDAPADATHGPHPAEAALAAGSSSRFVPVRPSRVLDTRSGLGGTVGPAAPGDTVTLRVAGSGGVPANGATAVAFNLTVTDTPGPGFVTAYPSGTDVPVASNVNVTGAGQTIANLVIVALPQSGSVSFYVHAGGHLIVDMAGYWVPSAKATSGRLVAVTPTRVLDTRDGTGGAGYVSAGQTIDVEIAGQAGIPRNLAAAVVLNVTATDTEAAGYVTVWATGRAQPDASSLNPPGPSSTVPNLVIAPVGVGGKVSFYSQNGTHLVADVAGYFTNLAAPADSVGLFVPVSPQRVLDTRARQPVPKFWPGQRRDIAVGGLGDVPAAGVAAAIVNLTATEPRAGGFVTAYPAVTTLPVASNLNVSGPGETRANLALVPLGTQGRISLYSQSGTELIADVSGYFVGDPAAPTPGVPFEPPPPPAPPVIAPAQLRSAPTCRNPAAFGAEVRVDVNPGLATLYNGVDWSRVDLSTLQYLAATIMWNSGSLPAYAGVQAEFNDWIARQYIEAGSVSPSPLVFTAWVATAYHEAIHFLQQGCLVANSAGGYAAPRLGPLQSALLGDVLARIDVLAPPGTGSSYCRYGALDAATFYLDPNDGGPGYNAGLANQRLESQLWEINAYVLELELETNLYETLGQATLHGDPTNLSIISAKLHQLARYLSGSRSSWPQMRSQGVHFTVADHWNLAVRWWRSRPNPANARACWDLAFGPDAAVIAEFTQGLAGTIAPPRP